MDEGPAKIRRTPTPRPTVLSYQVLYETDDRANLLTFYQTTLAGGSLTFDDQHPATLETVTYRFLGPPSFSSHSGGSLFDCRFRLEIMP